MAKRTECVQRDISLPESMRGELKAPFGPVITTPELKGYMSHERPGTIITVGDMVTAVVHEAGYEIKLAIVDNYTKRAKADDLSARVSAVGEKVILVKNPPAKITKELAREIRNALSSKGNTRLVVEGEEDLATLPCIIYANDDAVVVYGMPNVGMVMVKADKKMKAKVKKILTKMENA